MPFRPLGDRVMLAPVSDMGADARLGKVIAIGLGNVGPDGRNVPIGHIKKGDIVVYDPKSALPLAEEGHGNVVIVRVADVAAVKE